VVSVKPVVVEHSAVTKDAIAAFKLLQPQQIKLKPTTVKSEGRRGRSPQPGVRCLIERRTSNEQRRPSSRGKSACPSSADTSQADLSMVKASVDSTQPPSRTSSSCSFRSRAAPGVFKQLYSADIQRLMQIRRAHLDVSRCM
jgi:hypothetical protein